MHDNFMNIEEVDIMSDEFMKESLWPRGAKCCVNLTFDDCARGRFAPLCGTPRILKILKEYDVKATFFTGGWDTEEYPNTIKKIFDDGHEVAAHGFAHEPFDKLEEEDERRRLVLTHDILTDLLGVPPKGWRGPGGSISPRVPFITKELGYIYDSSFNNDDLPYMLEIDGKETGLVELPFAWILDDAPLYGVRKTASWVLSAWKEEFRATYEEGGYYGLCMHGDHSGRPSRPKVLEGLIRYIRGFPGVWWATCLEVAEWWLKRV